MKLRVATLAIGLTHTLAVIPSQAEITVGTREYSASAYALESDELLYMERHVETWRRGRLAERSVTYEDAEGNLIAAKQVRYGADHAAPSFEMTDYRIGLRESAAVGDDTVALFSGATNGRSTPRKVTLPDGAVIDAGFDAFMRENFAEILGGGRLEFDFAVPAARRFFKFRLLPQGQLDYKGEEALLVKMKPASRLLRLVLDPIDLIYGKDGRLLEFRGLSNVCDEQGDRYKARIVFDYSTDSPPALMARMGSTAAR